MEKELGTIRIIRADSGIRLEFEGLVGQEKDSGPGCCVVIADGKTSVGPDCCKSDSNN